MTEIQDNSPADLISVIIPAHNAADTILATLASVLQQSYRSLDVVVVNDGSTDATACLVKSIAARDPRLRLVSQENLGVGRARNLGVRWSTGPYIAFVDADDLWHPKKLELQHAVLAASDEDFGFVYSPCRIVDGAGNVMFTEAPYNVHGYCPLQSVYHNYVRNGSSWLCRRRAVEDIDGFEASLFERGAQGCEDIIFTIEIAQRWKVASCPEFLVGYRRSPTQMSGNAVRMAQSFVLSIDLLKKRSVVHVPSFVWRWSLIQMQMGTATSGLLSSGVRLRSLLDLLSAAFMDPLGFIDYLLEKNRSLRRAGKAKWLRLWRGSDKPHLLDFHGRRAFLEMRLDEGPSLRIPPIRAARLRHLAKLDRQLNPPITRRSQQ